MEINGSLKFTSMGHSARIFRFSDSVDHFAGKVPVWQGCRQSRSVIDQPASNQIAQHLIASMGIDINNSVKSLPNQRVPDVIAKIHEDFFANRDRARKAHVVFIESIMHDWQSQNESLGAACCFFGDIFYGQVVHVDRQMIAMLLYSCHWNNDYCSVLRSLLYFWPF